MVSRKPRAILNIYNKVFEVVWRPNPTSFMTFIKNFFVIFCLVVNFSSYATVTNEEYLTYATNRVASAILPNNHWDGPTTGPEISTGKSLIFVASDLRNGGVNAVAKGVSEAVSHLDWNLQFLDGVGSEIRQGAAIRKAVSLKPDGIILGGIDAERHANVLSIARKLGIVVIGWHASDTASGSNELGLFTNITTDPLAVAEIAALLAITETQGKAKTVIFTDPNYSIASMKSHRMVETLLACNECDILAVKEVSLEETAKIMPAEVDKLLAQFPNQITHFLTINDLYIDFAVPSLEVAAGKYQHLPISISAGDGSRAAYKRINQGRYQIATVPEPLNMQGWQIIDEMNRAFHGLTPSGYSAPVHLVTERNVSALIGKSDIYDPENGYRNAYLSIWRQE